MQLSILGCRCVCAATDFHVCMQLLMFGCCCVYAAINVQLLLCVYATISYWLLLCVCSYQFLVVAVCTAAINSWLLLCVCSYQFLVVAVRMQLLIFDCCCVHAAVFGCKFASSLMVSMVTMVTMGGDLTKLNALKAECWQKLDAGSWHSVRISHSHTYAGHHVSKLGLAKSIHIRCIYDNFGREITKHTVIYGVYVRFWPTLQQPT
jgi:hypothetical protein